MPITVTRYHDFSMGHKVTGHENKCSHLHGHNYRVFFTLSSADLDDIGRVIDFSVIKTKLCQWLEDKWDHRFLIYEEDPKAEALTELFPDDIIQVPFNPTAEHMAKYLVEKVGPYVLHGTDVTLIDCKVEETRKCSARYTL